ncbi:MAG: helix-turn-helix transcriptional regulator [Clostridia bacterium]|nr:helix-turn-helix transcriptional regulator [Clostridia bacterium]
MEDKKNFGKYITEKRKAVGLTQEELANKLYVIPTTVSKWERGITYPDITMITNLCKELHISEHEFFTACDDETMNQEKREIKRYRTIKKIIYYCISIGYIIALITCFICNLAIDHKTSWFLIVLTSIGISFSITNLPFYLKKDKYRVAKISFIVTILIYMLLFITNLVSNDNWVFQAFAIATFEFILLWLGIVIFTFTKIDKCYKISIALILLSICTAFTNPFCEKILNIVSQSDNTYNIIVAILLVIIAILISVKRFLSKKCSE